MNDANFSRFLVNETFAASWLHPRVQRTVEEIQHTAVAIAWAKAKAPNWELEPLQ